MRRTKRKANVLTRPSKRFRKAYTRKRYRYGVRGKGRLASLVKKTIIRMAEPKHVPCVLPGVGGSKVEMYHNTRYFYSINRTTWMPQQGNGDMARNGDQIYIKGWKFKMMLTNKFDRPNVTWKMYVIKTPKGTTCDSTTAFYNVTGNVLLDTVNTDYAKNILYSKVIKSQRSTLAAMSGSVADSKEFTEVYSFWLPYKRRYKFQQDNSQTHDDDDIIFIIMPYDAYGTLTTDNIGSCQFWIDMYYSDP